MLRQPSLVLVGLLVSCSFASSQAAEWNEFRGPTGQGLAESRNLPTTWSKTQNVVWQQELPGQGWSSPVIDQGRIYLTAAVPIEGNENGDLSLRLLALSAKDGKRLGSFELFVQDGATAPKIHSKNSHASPTPIVDDGRIYVHFGHQGTACVDRQGKVLWRRRIEYRPVHGNGGSPVLAGNHLIFSCDGSDRQILVALDAKTGEIAWQTERESDAAKKFSFGTPLLITVDGKQQVISPFSDSVCAYDPATGREIWRVRYDGYSVIPRPVFGHGLVFLSTGYNTPTLLAIRPDGEGDVTESHVAWKLKKGAPHTPSPLLAGDELYLVSDRGIASCLDAATGEVHWQKRVGGNYSASPIFAGGRIYLQSELGEGIVLAASKEFQPLAKNDLGERTLASYAVSGDALLIRTASHLYRIEGQ